MPPKISHGDDGLAISNWEVCVHMVLGFLGARASWTGGKICMACSSKADSGEWDVSAWGSRRKRWHPDMKELVRCRITFSVQCQSCRKAWGGVLLPMVWCQAGEHIEWGCFALVPTQSSPVEINVEVANDIFPSCYRNQEGRSLSFLPPSCAQPLQCQVCIE